VGGDVKESEAQKQVLDWLAAKHILAFRLNTGVANYDGRRVAFGVPGMSDILAFKVISQSIFGVSQKAIVPIWIEMKALKGRQSSLQASFQAQVEAEGHIYVLARSIDDLTRIFA
jgi:hypothetical protein